jgi:hypothetical protein
VKKYLAQRKPSLARHTTEETKYWGGKQIGLNPSSLIVPHVYLSLPCITLTLCFVVCWLNLSRNSSTRTYTNNAFDLGFGVSSINFPELSPLHKSTIILNCFPSMFYKVPKDNPLWLFPTTLQPFCNNGSFTWGLHTVRDFVLNSLLTNCLGESGALL